MARHLLPHLRPGQIKNEPDETTALINRIIDRLNELE